MLDGIIVGLLALGGMYIYGHSLIFISKLINDSAFKSKQQKSQQALRARARLLIESDPQVKKTYIALRVMYLKNKKSPKMTLLEQRLRSLVREKSVRHEILSMVCAKNSG